MKNFGYKILGLALTAYGFTSSPNKVRSLRSLLSNMKPIIDGEWRAIVRFDKAHGFFHRDIMSPSGKQEKQPQPAIDKNLALNEAINHIKNFWQTYRNAYEVEYHEQK